MFAYSESSQLNAFDKGFLNNSSHISQVICLKTCRITVDIYHILQLKISSAPMFAESLRIRFYGAKMQPAIRSVPLTKRQTEHLQ